MLYTKRNLTILKYFPLPGSKKLCGKDNILEKDVQNNCKFMARKEALLRHIKKNILCTKYLAFQDLLFKLGIRIIVTIVTNKRLS